MRVGGRLDESDEPFERCHPIIIDADHPLATLLVKNAHVATAHADTERTLAEVRARYWPLQGRCSIRKTIKQCIQCKIIRAHPNTPNNGKITQNSS